MSMGCVGGVVAQRGISDSLVGEREENYLEFGSYIWGVVMQVM